MIPQEIIRKKRDKKTLSKKEISLFVNGLTDGSFSDPQVAAMSMAIFSNGMSREETVDLTEAMTTSGDIISWADIVDDDLVCDVVLSGGSGVISVIGQALPALFSNMIHKGISGDEQAAKALEKSAMPLIGLIFEENNPAGIKAVLEQLGLCNDTVRLPLVTATEGLKLKIKNALAEL